MYLCLCNFSLPATFMDSSDKDNSKVPPTAIRSGETDSAPMKKKPSSASMPTVDVMTLVRAESLLNSHDQRGAAAIADAALLGLGDLSALSGNLTAYSQAALIKGMTLLTQATAAVMKAKLLGEAAGTNSGNDLYKKPLDMFRMALRLDPGNSQAQQYLEYVWNLAHPPKVQTPPQPHQHNPAPKQRNHALPFDVIVVGAGAAGVV